MNEHDYDRMVDNFLPTLLDELRVGIDRSLSQALTIWDYYTDGGYSGRDLMERDYPYAKRHDSPKLPLLPLNQQSENGIRNSFRLDRARVKGLKVSGGTYNVAPEAKFFDEDVLDGRYADGTKRMVARHIQEAVVADLEPVFTDIIEDSMARAAQKLGFK